MIEKIIDFNIEKENNNDNSPNFYKDIFPYSKLPQIKFDNIFYPTETPEDIWITDTTFRDGQQSMSSFTIDEIMTIFKYLNQLDNGSGIIRQTEFFLYTKKDQEALYKCRELGFEFPEITAWIRSNKKDLELVSQLEIPETGILMSCSDYHIYKKLGLDRKSAAEKYLDFVKHALDKGIKPRCHLEDITRADFYGFVVPLVSQLMKLSKESGIEIKIRACDTLGLGVSHSGASLPRSVAGIIQGLRKIAKVPSKSIEWHGHNDFHCVVPNSTSAWLNGASSVNTTVLGIGERTGNCPMEAMIVEYAQLKGDIKEMNLEYITRLSEFFEKRMNYPIHPKFPFIGSEFNLTKAGIHADGILKDKEIYNAFDTKKILNRPIVVAVNQYSGLAGIAAWINTYFDLDDSSSIDKRDIRLLKIKSWIDKEYKDGRTSVISNHELKTLSMENFAFLKTIDM